MRFTMMAARKKKPNGITTKTITVAAVFIYSSLNLPLPSWRFL